MTAAAFDTVIVGTRYRGAIAVRIVGSLPRGALLKLVREPHNEHDPNAVAVYWEHYHLGYVPRPDNLKLARIFAGRRAGELVAEVILEAIVHDGDICFAPKIRITGNGNAAEKDWDNSIRSLTSSG